MNCQHCNRPMRPYNTRLDQYPGTIQRAAADACVTCQEHYRQAQKQRPQDEYLHREHAAFLAARKARGVPDTGLSTNRRYLLVSTPQNGRTRLETQQAAMWKFRGYRLRNRVLTGPPIGIWQAGIYHLYAPIKRATPCAA